MLMFESLRSEAYKAVENAVVDKQKDLTELKAKFDALFQLDENSESVSVLDYLARGLPLPASIISFTLFIRAHQAQLEVFILFFFSFSLQSSSFG